MVDIPVQLVGRTQEIERAAVLWLQSEMRGEVRVPPWLLSDVHAQRRTAFNQLVAAGRSASQIAKELGLPKKRVKKMLKIARPISVVV
jgi:DNA-directed RNA polymerase specialized sigma24 family protein